MQQQTNIAWDVMVPIITNKIKVKKDEELILEVRPVKKKEKEVPDITWKSGVKRGADQTSKSSNKSHKNAASESLNVARI